VAVVVTDGVVSSDGGATTSVASSDTGTISAVASVDPESVWTVVGVLATRDTAIAVPMPASTSPLTRAAATNAVTFRFLIVFLPS